MTTSNRLLGLLALGIGIAVFTAGFGIDVPPGTEDSLSPRFFPQTLALALSGLGIALMLQGGGDALEIVWGKLRSLRSACLLGLVALYTLSFGFMDFRLGTLLFMGCGMWAMGERKKWQLAVTPVAVSLLVYALFRYGFLVLLPTWG